MSSYQILLTISLEMKNLLWEAFRNDDEIDIGEAEIVFNNPTVAIQKNSAKLSLWLYRVTENGYQKNSPMIRGGNGQERQYPPLALDLYFLVTPISKEEGSVDNTLLILGKTMQALYDRAITIHHREEYEDYEELRISLMPLTLEEQTRIWEALQEPYQLSVCYQVRVAHIQSERASTVAPVAERSADFEN